MKIAVAQINFVVGDIDGNVAKILKYQQQAINRHAQLVVFSELSLCGYPPEDLLLREDFYLLQYQALEELAKQAQIYLVVGHISKKESKILNSISLVYQGQIIDTYHKEMLPNYAVFDERRYFDQDDSSCVLDINGVQVGFLICEDLWYPHPMENLRSQGAELVIAPNASPYRIGFLAKRQHEMKKRFKENHLPIIFANQVGAQDELVFDGASFFIDHQGNIGYTAKELEEDLFICEYTKQQELISLESEQLVELKK